MKYEDLRTVLQMFFPGMFVFSFDLRSAYHHIDICDKHRKFLSFKWTSSDGVTKFYELKVLLFVCVLRHISSPKFYVNSLNIGEVVAI